jgi:hypothetical protein
LALQLLSDPGAREGESQGAKVGRSQAERRWKMQDLEEFVSQFEYLFSSEELEEIEARWNDKYRNAIILGIYDRREHYSHEEREKLIQWLDAHPDQWTIEFEEVARYRPSLREVLIDPKENRSPMGGMR